MLLISPKCKFRKAKGSDGNGTANETDCSKKDPEGVGGELYRQPGVNEPIRDDKGNDGMDGERPGRESD